MSDTLSITLRSVDRHYLKPLAVSNAAHKKAKTTATLAEQKQQLQARYNCIVEKVHLIDAERKQNGYLNDLIENRNYGALRQDFDKLRRERFGGIAKKMLPGTFNPAFNKDVDQIATLVENVDYLYTRQIMEQPALFIGAISPLVGATAGMYMQQNQDDWQGFDPVKISFAIALTGLSIAGITHASTIQRSGNQMRPWNAIAYVESNISFYQNSHDIIRNGTFTDVQSSSKAIQWQYYDEPLHWSIKNDPGVNPNVCSPLFKEGIASKSYVALAQISADFSKLKAKANNSINAKNNAESL